MGGGIAGLAAAWELSAHSEVTVFEPGHIGGRIVTEPFEGLSVEAGPDAFITRVPEALDLCAELGVNDLVSPSAGRTLIWWAGRTRELPEGLVLGVPRRLGPVIRSGLITPTGWIRAAGDLVLPNRLPDGDMSVRDLVAGRFGSQIADRLVDPLVGGIHAGTIAALSAEATVPQLLAAARRSRSLLVGLRRAAGGGPEGPIFATPRGGLSVLVDALVARLRDRSVLFESLAVSGLSRRQSRWWAEPSDTPFDGVVLATSAAVTARILGTEAPAGLGAVTTASVVLVTLGYPDLGLPPGINGVLVPRSSGLLTTACSFASAKWPHWAGPGRTILRVSTGRAGDDRAISMGDDELRDRLAEEIAQLTGRSVEPETHRVSRWPDSFPQYRVGHGNLVRAIEGELHVNFPGVEVCGSSYGGAGLPACISSGRSAGRRIAARQQEKGAA